MWTRCPGSRGTCPEAACCGSLTLGRTGGGLDGGSSPVWGDDAGSAVDELDRPPTPNFAGPVPEEGPAEFPASAPAPRFPLARPFPESTPPLPEPLSSTVGADEARGLPDPTVACGNDTGASVLPAGRGSPGTAGRL